MSKLAQKEFNEKLKNGSLTNFQIIEQYELSNEYEAYKNQLTKNFTVSDKLLAAAKNNNKIYKSIEGNFRDKLFEQMIIIDFIVHSKNIHQEVKDYAYLVFISDLDKLGVQLENMQAYNTKHYPFAKWYMHQDYKFINDYHEQPQEFSIRNQTFQQLESKWNTSYTEDLKKAALIAIFSDKNIDQISEFKNLLKSISSEVETKLTQSNSHLPKKIRSDLINRYLAEDVKHYLMIQVGSLDLESEFQTYAQDHAANVKSRSMKVNDKPLDSKNNTNEELSKSIYEKVIARLRKNRSEIIQQGSLNFENLVVHKDKPIDNGILGLQEKRNENLLRQSELRKILEKIQGDEEDLKNKTYEIDELKKDIEYLDKKTKDINALRGDCIKNLENRKKQLDNVQKTNIEKLNQTKETLQHKLAAYRIKMDLDKTDQDEIKEKLNSLKDEQKMLDEQLADSNKSGLLNNFHAHCIDISRKALKLQFEYTQAIAQQNNVKCEEILQEFKSYDDKFTDLENHGAKLGLNDETPIMCALKLSAEAVNSYAERVSNKNSNKSLKTPHFLNFSSPNKIEYGF